MESFNFFNFFPNIVSTEDNDQPGNCYNPKMGQRCSNPTQRRLSGEILKITVILRNYGGSGLSILKLQGSQRIIFLFMTYNRFNSPVLMWFELDCFFKFFPGTYKKSQHCVSNILDVGYPEVHSNFVLHCLKTVFHLGKVAKLP